MISRFDVTNIELSGDPLINVGRTAEGHQKTPNFAEKRGVAYQMPRNKDGF
jgi:hypothetical protein